MVSDIFAKKYLIGIDITLKIKILRWKFACNLLSGISSNNINNDVEDLIVETRPNEFGSMTARKCDIKPQHYKEQGHTWLYKAIKTTRGHIRPRQFNTIMCHRRYTLPPLHCFFMIFMFTQRNFFCSLCTFFVPLRIFCSLAHFLFPCTLFVPFGIFFTHISTTRRRTHHLGSLSVARGQKVKKIC